MPQESYPFAVGRIKVLETRMLDRAKWNRLRDADTREGYDILIESGYGASAQKNGDVELLIAAELADTRALIEEITPAPRITRLFLLPTDAHNLKALFKARLLGIDPDDVLMQGGLFPPELLKAAVSAQDYAALPEPLCGALTALETALAEEPSPRLLSAAVDSAVFQYILKELKDAHDKTVTDYFRLKIDFLNVESLIRGIALEWDQEKLRPLLIEGGYIPAADYMPSLSLPKEQLPRAFGRSKSAPFVEAALEEYFQSGDVSAAVRRMDDALARLTREGRFDSFGIGPILCYLTEKEAEAKALRMLFAAKRAGRDPLLPEQFR